MRAAILLAALAAAVLVLRRNRPVTVDADDSEVVGMPTTWPEPSVITNTFTLGPIDWDAWFDTAGRRN